MIYLNGIVQCEHCNWKHFKLFTMLIILSIKKVVFFYFGIALNDEGSGEMWALEKWCEIFSGDVDDENRLFES